MAIETSDFDYLRTLVRDHAGIVLEPGKEYLVESRLQPLARREGIDSLSALSAKLRLAGSGDLRRKVIEAMTTNETTFFRDVEPFEALRKFVLPQLVEARRPGRRLRIWCAASSTGQEPYSLAMLIHEHFPELLTWDLGILATDIAPSVLERAREGCYRQVEVNRGLPATYLVKYFDKQGNEWRLREAIRRMVRFEELNLIRPWPPMETMDIVLIRNVMIYFDLDIKRQILAGIRRVLHPDGHLFLGCAETTMNIDDGFVRQQYERAGCYRRRLAA